MKNKHMVWLPLEEALKRKDFKDGEGYHFETYQDGKFLDGGFDFKEIIEIAVNDDIEVLVLMPLEFLGKENVNVNIVLLSDNEVQLWTDQEYDDAVESAEDFDGFCGWQDVGGGLLQRSHVDHLLTHWLPIPEVE